MTNQTESKEIRSNFSLSLLKNEIVWLILLVVTLYFFVIFITFNRNDPGWSHASYITGISNLGGRTGAWISDFLLFIFGLSAWWIALPLIKGIWSGFKRISAQLRNEPDIPPSSPLKKFLSIIGFILLIVSSSGIEYLRIYRTSAQLPNIPGGVVGEIVSRLSSQYLGFTGSTALLGVITIISFSLCLQKSWIYIVEQIGAVAETVFFFFKRPATKKTEEQTTASDLNPVLQEKSDVLTDDSPIQENIPSSNITNTSEPELSNNLIEENSSLQESQDSFPADVIPETVSTPIEPVLEKVEPTETTEAFSSPTTQIAEEPKPAATSWYQPSADPAFDFGDIDMSSPIPPLSLLDPPEPKQESASPESLEYISRLIERKLAEFGVKVKVVSAFPGPVVTRYEIEPAVGVKGSSIVNLSKDLARSLSLPSLRVVENVPGKTYMALELPNSRRQIVRLSEILNSEEYNHSTSNLTVALGKDITGRPVVADLARMPHLLIAGTTGSGKSVGINATILSLLYKSTPDQVKLILIDPKMLELSVYQDIPHLLAPVVIDMKKAENALNWAVSEMGKRYLLMSKMSVRNLAGYNKKIADAEAREQKIPNPFSLTPDAPEPLEKLPQIVIIVDEFSDLMMTVGKKVEQSIARIAQKARAAGIHLILATQRPSVDVITGLIKANVPTRIAFQVSSKIDSRTILDQTGAETLLGLGDMLYLPSGTGIPKRVHGAFVSDDEVTKIAEYLRNQGEPAYIDGILDGPIPDEDSDNGGYGTDDAESDEKYDEAVAIVLKNKKASISLVQRHLRIGYNRAARLLEQMERSGLVSPMKNNGTRDVIVPTSNNGLQ